MNQCVNIACIFNDKTRRGLCVGVAPDAKPYFTDVIRFCWVTEKPSQKKLCTVKLQTQVTPQEAVGVGVGLIRASMLGDSLIRKVMVEANAISYVGPKVGGVTNEKTTANVREEETQDD